MNKILIDLPREIDTPHLILRMPQAGMGQGLCEAISDGYEDCIRWLGWPPIMQNSENFEIDCRKHHAEFVLRDCIRYIIFEKRSNTVVGRCAFPPQQANWSIPQFGISYFIRKLARSKGYASEASFAMANLAFNNLKAKKVEIHCEAENVCSSRIPQKLGFKLEYSMKGNWPRSDGQLANMNVYAIFSKDDLTALGK